MKLNGEFVIREFNDIIYAVPKGLTEEKLNGAVSLNATCKLLWEALIEGTDRDSMVELLLKHYDIKREIAENDVDSFIDAMKKADLLI